MLTGKKIVLGVSGGIAAYKMANVASMLVKLHADVHVVMTENATHFITPETFETLTANRCYTNVFDRSMDIHVPHVTLGSTADAILIAPASADVLGKIAHGIADDMLTTTILPATCPVMLAPSMNVHMYENPIVQNNMNTLRTYGYEIIEADEGFLACRDIGKGKLPPEDVLVEYILRACAKEKDLTGKKVLVTAGATMEAIDPVRYITNHSTGKMGYAVARRAMLRGAEVTLVTGQTSLDAPMFVNVLQITSAKDMYEAVTAVADEQDIIIKSAAVADYRPITVADHKIKKKDGDMSISLERTDDILSYLGAHKKPGQFICGFSMETENLIENSKAKLEKKHVDMIAANNLNVAGAGFKTDTNVITLITKDSVRELPLQSKEDVADCILDEIIAKMKA
ncbi:MAG: bifunctional phosphopantothenoylcysteine decarboxylase/phosphopantothenate--cysteine ligase CoaBC [Eubacteriales bacterium]|nr:bifunctional phosphopantothenoylcysteine decarboxylase/phosphopantothenate--cysteine ligase CoaBC [Lachnospiraceae bacterium]MDO5126487.1 bifunctional phosphopantothenoylcysteine decarboxylase/phosphopantothenate--cysteine ligase CoaBC [Eubacteriales bacterium]